jgi:L-alanine-DL-glutamate epimerase-like enolase superfamily enzyme
MDAEGYVRVPQEPGMGYRIRWEYIEANRVEG